MPGLPIVSIRDQTDMTDINAAIKHLQETTTLYEYKTTFLLRIVTCNEMLTFCIFELQVFGRLIEALYTCI